MPSIVGFREFRAASNPVSLLDEMVAASRVNPSDVVNIYSNEHINLGSVQLDVLPAQSQPVWNVDQRIGVVMVGEIFGYDEQKKDLQKQGYFIEDGNMAQFVACLYQEEGEEFVSSLNGAFAIAIWDARQSKLLLANDRLGYEPLYYAHTPERFIFASSMRSLLTDTSLPRKINILATAQFLTFDHVLGNQTFLKDIHLLPPASILILVDGQIKVQSYWQLEFPEHYSFRSEHEYQEELLFLARQAVTRQYPEAPAGVMLSGGLDSRVVLALLREKQLDVPLRAFTFGSSDCDDLHYAKELSSKLNVPHDFYPLRPDYLTQQAEHGIRLVDGMGNVVHMHTLDNLAAQSEQAQIIYKGFLGDALTGYFSYRDMLAPYNIDELTEAFFERYPIVFRLDVHNQLFSSDNLAQINTALLDSVRSEMSPSDAPQLAVDLFFKFDLFQRQRRLTLNGVRLVRSRVIVRSPFYDNDLLDFMLRIPQGYRLERYLITQTFVRAFPELAKIPSTASGYPMMPCRRELFMRLNEHIRWRLRAAGLKNVKVIQKKHYANYNDWFRGALRDWAEEILLRGSFLERGYFNPKYIHQIFQEHLSGQDHFKKLGALISIELWHREFID